MSESQTPIAMGGASEQPKAHAPQSQEGDSDRLTRWARTASSSAERIAGGLRRYQFAVLFLLSSLYLLATCYRASRKLFWFDELFTVYVSRLPDMASVWSALKQGVDFNPPLFYGLTRISETLFGEGHIAARLPEILAFWICCLCLFRFVSARTSVLAGLLSMLFPVVTTAYYYACEARSHGIVLGFAGIALISWQGAIRSKPRAGWLIGLFGALFCALLTHTYAVLLLVPFALAEFVRALSLKRIDWAVWLAIVAASSGALFSLPLFQATKTGIPRLYLATGSMLASAYKFHLAPAAGVLSAALVLYFVLTFAASKAPPAATGDQPSLELPEVVALLAFVAMPFFAFLVAKLTGTPYLHRYTISTVAGFSCLFGIVMAQRPPVGLGVLVILLAQIGLNFVEYSHAVTVADPTTLTALSTRADEFAYRYEAMDAVADKSAPIVLLDDLEFFPTMHYAPPHLASRLVYLIRPEFDVNGEGYLRLQRLAGAPGRIERMADFLAVHDTFIARGNFRLVSQISYLIGAARNVRMESVSEDSFLVSITLRKQPGESAAVPAH